MLGIIGQQCCVRFHGYNAILYYQALKWQVWDAFGLNNRDVDDMIEHVNYCTSVKPR